MIKHNKLHILFLVTLFLFTGPIFAQETEDKIFQLNAGDLDTEDSQGQIGVYSASRSEKFIEELPVTVYVITREEILQNGYTSLVDVLKSVPGVKVSQPGSGIEGETFILRGLYGNYYTKILVDDIPIQPSVVSGMPIGDQLPIRQAERIEIILGPASAVYGADALAGVINIVTYNSERPVYAQADIAIGTTGRDYLNVMIGGKVGKDKNILEYNLYGSTSNRRDMKVKYDIDNVYNPSVYDSTGAYLDAPYYKGDSTVPVMERLPSSSRMIGFGLKWRGFKFDFHNMTRKSHSSIGQRTTLYSYADPSNFWGEQIQRYHLSYEAGGEKVFSQTHLSYLMYRLDEQSSFGIIYDGGVGGRGFKYAASDDLILEQIVTYKPIPKLELTGGVYIQVSGNLPKTNDLKEPFNRDDYKPFSDNLPEPDSALGYFGYYPVTFSNIAGFLQVYLDLDRFNILISDRYDYNNQYGGYNNPRVAILFDLNKHMSVRGSFGTSFRAPSTYYTFSSLAYATPDGNVYDIVPNEDLTPETFMAAELGYRWNISKKINLDVALYVHELKNQFTRNLFLLDSIKYPNARGGATLTNAYVNNSDTRAELFGFQAALNMDDLVESIHLDLDLFVSYATGSETLPNNFGKIDGYRLMPEVMGQLNFSITPWKPLYIYFRNIYASSSKKRFYPLPAEIMEATGRTTEVKGYYTLDLIIRGTISRNFNAFMRLDNVFNSKYGGIDAYGNQYDLVYNPQYGRSFLFGLTFNMN